MKNDFPSIGIERLVIKQPNLPFMEVCFLFLQNSFFWTGGVSFVADGCSCFFFRFPFFKSSSDTIRIEAFLGEDLPSYSGICFERSDPSMCSFSRNSLKEMSNGMTLIGCIFCNF